MSSAPPSDALTAALDVALTAEEIAQSEISLANTPSEIIAKIQAILAARRAKIDADTTAPASPDALEKIRQDNV